MRATPRRRDAWPRCWTARGGAGRGRRTGTGRHRRHHPIAGCQGLRRRRRRGRIRLRSAVGDDATYTFAGVAKILEISESKLRYWSQGGFVGPSVRRGGKQLFNFQDLVSVKAAKELADRGFKTAEVRKALG